MEDRDAAIADALESLHINQTALRAAIEEVSTWIRQRGSVNAHENTMTCLQALDANADAIASAIERLRS
ncbi:Clp protease N-terminal domain-containing protein [Pseudomonas putida]|nr:Clp protease N-terminal domain-containing protein [Pseudomonas putida]